mmetsp:Transcript_84049/g.211940  ORF Transcript_84049/g.211940 Transcript_84049/m.211940 type:complete len:277 (-) Transcript_84049:37-867(-)
MVSVEEEILAKTGPELFKELLRIYPVAEIDDYFKAGQWKNDQMKADLQLIHVHRREAGAPDPMPLEDVKMPEMPQVVAMNGGIQMPTAVRPVGAAAAPIRPVVAKAGANAVPAAAAPGAAVNAATELRLIALFIAKWKLDATRVKMMLAKLLPARRRYVIQHFKTTSPGPEATNALEQFIVKCGQTNAWAGAVVTAPSGAALRPMAPMTMTGVKRPAATPLMAEAAKMPRIVPKPAATPLRPMQAAIRPNGAAMMRPPNVRPAAPGGVIRGLLQRA